MRALRAPSAGRSTCRPFDVVMASADDQCEISISLVGLQLDKSAGKPKVVSWPSPAIIVGVRMPGDEPWGPGADVLVAKQSQTQPTARDAGPLYTLAPPDVVEMVAPRAALVSQTADPPNRCALLAVFPGELFHDPGLAKLLAPRRNAAIAAWSLRLKSKPR
jgi:hypothetical protein